ncbi:MAG: protein-S-isoprenylcysteine O-methyltransferase-like protein [Candidatus Saganbacteria bacterium]|uniref:Protein-S-isoprenylcysteine O-methyltransferase-like protein n=1 Tax=Candidatus Saganbacteria bacterium TaxID=2575572 RepID=A0A833NSF3_UNCSA|nr:MAG: protein-S-isoprenylcysteine O-methyltransferase-like protein [Candidatus Saganbacteria bacterium]
MERAVLEDKLKTILIYFLSLLFFLAILPAAIVVSGLFLDKLFELSQVIYHPYNLIFASVFVIFGLFWMAWSLYSLIIIGKGNPQEAFGKEILPASKKLVIIGPYRYTRNPMGFGWFMVMVGVGLSLGSLSLLLIILPLFLAAVIIYLKSFEEKKLLIRFGADYMLYRNKVPMILPRL